MDLTTAASKREQNTNVENCMGCYFSSKVPIPSLVSHERMHAIAFWENDKDLSFFHSLAPLFIQNITTKCECSHSWAIGSLWRNHKKHISFRVWVHDSDTLFLTRREIVKFSKTTFWEPLKHRRNHSKFHWPSPAIYQPSKKECSPRPENQQLGVGARATVPMLTARGNWCSSLKFLPRWQLSMTSQQF